MSNDQGLIGLLSDVELSKDEVGVFMELISNRRNGDSMKALRYVLGDIEQFLLFLDMFAGESIKIPTREFVLRMCDWAKIWAYYNRNPNRSEIAKVFKRRINVIDGIINKVDMALNGGDKKNVDESGEEGTDGGDVAVVECDGACYVGHFTKSDVRVIPRGASGVLGLDSRGFDGSSGCCEAGGDEPCSEDEHGAGVFDCGDVGEDEPDVGFSEVHGGFVV